MKKIENTTLLSVLWLFILLNIVFRDIHQMTLKSHLEMLLTGYYNGMKVTDWIMLIGAVLVEIPIAMVLFSHLLKDKWNRVANVIAAVLFTAVLLFTPPTDMDDVFHLTIELIAIGAIVWTAWKWPQQERPKVVSYSIPL